MLNVLFLDSANASYSLIAESILRATSRGKFQAYSAGCLSASAISPAVLAFLRERDLPTEGLRSKGLRELTGPEAPAFAFVIALSELGAITTAERAFPGDPVTAHWRLDTEEESELEPSVWTLRDSYWILSRRIKIFTATGTGPAELAVAAGGEPLLY